MENKGIIELVKYEKNQIANLANLSSHIFYSYTDLNWCGFYLWNEDDQELVLGPFQGKIACVRIKAERGVCGKSFTTQSTLIIPNVHEFPDHIACDSASNSELVIPLMYNGKCHGVLDLDSPLFNRFDEAMSQELEGLIQSVVPYIFK